MRQILYILLQIPGLSWFLLSIKLGRKNEYLHKNGWYRSARELASVNADGTPLAWFTYPFLRFVEPRLNKNLTVYEFGSGNGTLWWSQRVKSVTAMEHSAHWANKSRENAPENVEIIQADLAPNGDYATNILSANKTYDIIVVDGRERVSCAKSAAKSLTSGGVIIWDNSDRIEYQVGMDDLVQAGFKRLDFYGLVAINSNEMCTSIFYKNDNVLGL